MSPIYLKIALLEAYRLRIFVLAKTPSIIYVYQRDIFLEEQFERNLRKESRSRGPLPAHYCAEEKLEGLPRLFSGALRHEAIERAFAEGADVVRNRVPRDDG